MSKSLKILGIMCLVIVLVLLGYGLFIAIKFEKLVGSLPDVTNQVVTDTDKSFSLIRISENDTTYKINGKIIFLNFWEGWCKPCLEEMPSINSLYKKIYDSTTNFYIISSDRKFDSIVLLTSKKYEVPFYKLRDSLPNIFKAEIFPRSYIIHGNKVVMQKLGADKWDSDNIVKFIDSLKRI